MPIHLLIQGITIGVVVAVPVGPLGLLCINRAFSMGAMCGLLSGLGVATADALAAGVAALGLSLISRFFADHQILLRLIGGLFLCCLGYKIYKTEPARQARLVDVNGLLGAYATTFLLTISNPVTILSFVAIYAGWGVESLSGHYLAAGVLTLGVFTGSSLWWVAMFVGMTSFRDRFSLHLLEWIHRLSGAVIVGFGIIVLLTLSPLKFLFGIDF
ncbi:MAG TPA: LysE family transporter [Candidatus Binatia bacterium]|nr:LysE family transporter [Candidatus Binatia bacterium]